MSSDSISGYNESLDVFQIYKNKNIFITGGSGFIGKVLLEKILRTIPDVGNIYLLLRTKKGKRPNERIKEIFESKVSVAIKYALNQYQIIITRNYLHN